MNSLLQKTREIIESKKTRLCVALDYTSADELLRMAELLAPKVCMLKTHIDIVEDFSPRVTEQLQELAHKHSFLIFEDRKFADIGKTVELQYEKGVYHMSEWADIVNAHTVSGPGTIQALADGAARVNEPRGLLLLAQMTPEGNLITEEYTAKSVEYAKQFPDFVIGFIGNGGDVSELKKLREMCGSDFLICAPGVKLGGGGDARGQRYTTPKDVIAAGADVIIVGRGITEAKDPVTETEKYCQV
ncbi:MAG: orotidine-5'-phosphate decarboxylase [Candidatus Kerfeldbacteria bacterium]|nr:orotidine-5'-phosphate decarboxylase [Candidatus Kerfeldbacteria bacterium]